MNKENFDKNEYWEKTNTPNLIYKFNVLSPPKKSMSFWNYTGWLYGNEKLNSQE